MAITPLFDEQELLAKIAKGDVQAFAQVFEYYRRRVYTVALQYLGSEPAAEDVVQEIFLKLWRLREQLVEVRSLEAYLRQLTKYQCLNTLRRMKLESAHMEPIPKDFEVSVSDTEDQVLLNDTRKIVDRGLELLPPQQRLVFQLCRLEGLKYAEVSDQLGISPETVRSHLKLALRFLRSYVSQHTDLAVLLIIFRIF